MNKQIENQVQSSCSTFKRYRLLDKRNTLDWTYFWREVLMNNIY